MTTSDSDINDPMSHAFSFFSPQAQQDPYPLYARARAEAPVFFAEELGMWVVTRYDDACKVLRDPARFSSRLTTMQTVKAPPSEVMDVLRKGYPRTPAFINQDPPEHTRLRGIGNAAFTHERTAMMEGSIREFANRLIDEFEADGRADIMSRFAGPLPKLVIADVVGVPHSDIAKFGQWADEMGMLLFAAGLPTERWVQAAEGFVALQRYIAEMIKRHKGQQGDDLLSTFIRAETDDSGRVDVPRIISYIAGFLIAGQKTTMELIGSALTHLLQHPQQFSAALRNPERMPAVIEETIRRDAPVPGTVRVTTEDVQLGNVTIPKDARVLALLGSANHDEAVFEDPSRFDIERPNAAKHLGFGYGVHFCIGAPLARLEGRVALEVLTQRLENLRFDGPGPVQFSQIVMYRGPVTLPLAWDVPRGM